MTVRKIAVYRGSFNPPGRRHRSIAEALSREFDELVIAPWHTRPGEEVKYDVAPVYRATMIDLAFQDLPNVRIEFFDLEAGACSPPGNAIQKLKLEGDISIVVSPSVIEGGRQRQSTLHKAPGGEALWREKQFIVVRRPGEEIHPGDLPPRHRFLKTDAGGSSEEIRERIFRLQSIEDWVDPAIEQYIRRHDLYRGMPHVRTTKFRVEELRPLIFADERNDKAIALLECLPSEDDANPNIILVLGGDGTMLRAIRQHWRRRLPFYGINTGHLGFLLNNALPDDVVGRSLILEQISLLRVEMIALNGERKVSLAFNDAWVERGTGQTAWIEVKVNGKTRLSRLVADGVLVATAGGSTSYARAMGATPLPLSTPALLLVGSNVLLPVSWRPVLLPLGSLIELRTLDPDKRPLEGFVDGTPHGRVQGMKVHTSNVAAVELAFDPSHVPAEKLARIQFPMPDELIAEDRWRSGTATRKR